MTILWWIYHNAKNIANKQQAIPAVSAKEWLVEASELLKTD
jgi:hypothetical protein